MSSGPNDSRPALTVSGLQGFFPRPYVRIPPQGRALADSLGFVEANHFTRFFRQNLGIPPSEYRRRVELFG